MWQTRGISYAQYQTSPYTFVFNPPSIPEKNPCAAYRINAGETVDFKIEIMPL